MPLCVVIIAAALSSLHLAPRTSSAASAYCFAVLFFLRRICVLLACCSGCFSPTIAPLAVCHWVMRPTLSTHSAFGTFAATSPLPNIQTFVPPTVQSALFASLHRKFQPQSDPSCPPFQLLTDMDAHEGAAADAAAARATALVSALCALSCQVSSAPALHSDVGSLHWQRAQEAVTLASTALSTLQALVGTSDGPLASVSQRGGIVRGIESLSQQVEAVRSVLGVF